MITLLIATIFMGPTHDQIDREVDQILDCRDLQYFLRFTNVGAQDAVVHDPHVCTDVIRRTQFAPLSFVRQIDFRRDVRILNRWTARHQSPVYFQINYERGVMLINFVTDHDIVTPRRRLVAGTQVTIAVNVDSNEPLWIDDTPQMQFHPLTREDIHPWEQHIPRTRIQQRYQDQNIRIVP